MRLPVGADVDMRASGDVSQSLADSLGGAVPEHGASVGRVSFEWRCAQSSRDDSVVEVVEARKAGLASARSQFVHSIHVFWRDTAVTITEHDGARESGTRSWWCVFACFAELAAQEETLARRRGGIGCHLLFSLISSFGMVINVVVIKLSWPCALWRTNGIALLARLERFMYRSWVS